MTVVATQIGGVHDLSAVRSGTVTLIVINEATCIELNHHRIVTAVKLRQHDEGVVVRCSRMNAQRMAVVTAYFLMTGCAVRRETTGRLVTLPLDEPLVTVHRLLIGDTHIEACRFVISGIGLFADYDIVLLPIV